MTSYKKLSDRKIKFKKRIRDWAQHSMYRMNAESADCYAFNYIDDNRSDFEGGWDWKNNLVDKNATHILDLETLDFFEIVQN